MSRIIWIFLPLIIVSVIFCEWSFPILWEYDKNEAGNTPEARIYWIMFWGGAFLGVVSFMEIVKRSKLDFK